MNVYFSYNVLRLYFYISCLWGVLTPVSSAEIMVNIVRVSDTLVMVFLCISIIYSCFINKVIYKDLFWAFVFLFILTVYSILNSYFRDYDIGNVLIYNSTLLRFYFLIIFVWQLVRLGRDNVNFVLYIEKSIHNDIVCIFLLLSIILLLQIFTPSFGEMFIPNINEFQSSIRAFDSGEYPSSFPNTIDFSFLILVFSFYFLLRIYIFKTCLNLILFFLCLVEIYLSGSQASFLCAIVVLFLFIYHSLGLIKVPIKSFFVILLFVALLFFAYFSLEQISEKIDNMYLSRLGLLFIVLPDLLVNNLHDLFLGFSPDFSSIVLVFRTLPNALAIFQYDSDVAIINDVFWFALLVSYGFLFTLILVFLVLFIIKKTISNCEDSNGWLFNIIAFIVLVLGFFNQVLMVRTFIISLAVVLLFIGLVFKPELDVKKE